MEPENLTYTTAVTVEARVEDSFRRNASRADHEATWPAPHAAALRFAKDATVRKRSPKRAKFAMQPAKLPPQRHAGPAADSA